MNKYFSKALFYDDITKSSVPNFCMVFIAMIIPILNLFSNRTSENILSKYHTLEEGIEVIILFMCIASIASIYESYNNKDRKYEFMLSQPYSRDAIVITKFISTVIAAITPIIIYGVMSTIYFSTEVSGDFIIKFWEKILMGIAITFLIIAIYQFVNKIVGNSIVCIFIPMIFFIEVEVVIIWIYKTMPVIGELLLNNFVEPFLEGTVDYFLKANIMISLILICTSFVIVNLSVVLNRKLNYEKASELFIFNKAEKFFYGLVAIVISIIIIFIIYIFINKSIYNIEFISESIEIISNIALIIGSFGVYKLFYYIKKRVR